MIPPQILNFQITESGALQIQWVMDISENKGVIVSVMRESEGAETEKRRVFVLPMWSECTLSLEPGNWWIRVGNCEGSMNSGKVQWSGIYGPCLIPGSQTPGSQTPGSQTPGSQISRSQTPIKCPIQVVHSQPTQTGVRLFTDIGRRGTLIEVCGESEGGAAFPIGATKWYYFFDKGLGWIDCPGLPFPNTYSIRISAFDVPPIETIAFPWKYTLPHNCMFEASGTKAFHRQISASIKRFQDMSTNTVDNQIVGERNANPTMKFASHADYLKYVAALTRTSDTKKSLS